MNRTAQWVLASAVAGLIPGTAFAQLGAGGAGRAVGSAAGSVAGAAQASRAQAQAQQRVQAQVQQRVQAQVQQRAGAQVQQRAQAQLGRAAAVAGRAASAVQQRVAGGAQLRAQADAGAQGRARAGQASLSAGANARLDARADARVPNALSEADLHYYDDVLGRFNPFRQPAPQRTAENSDASASSGAPSAGDAANRPAARPNEPEPLVAAGHSADVAVRIHQAVRQRRTEISQIRDRALETGNAQLMLHAEQLEAKLQAFVAAQARTRAAANSALNRATTGAANAAANASATAAANANANSAVLRQNSPVVAPGSLFDASGTAGGEGSASIAPEAQTASRPTDATPDAQQ